MDTDGYIFIDTWIYRSYYTYYMYFLALSAEGPKNKNTPVARST